MSALRNFAEAKPEAANIATANQTFMRDFDTFILMGYSSLGHSRARSCRACKQVYLGLLASSQVRFCFRFTALGFTAPTAPPPPVSHTSLMKPSSNAHVVLLTRPRQDGRRTAARLAIAGYSSIRMPLLGIRHTPQARQLNEDLVWSQRAGIQIFVSRAAVAAACARAAPAVRAARLRLAVGSATAAALRDRGHACEVAPTGAEDSEGLLGLPSLQSVRGQRIVLWAAPGGRDQLATTLSERGADVRVIFIYRRIPLRPPARVLQQLQRSPERLVLTATSGALLAELDRVLMKAGLSELRARPLIVASPRIAELARQRGYPQVEVAAGASNQALLAALDRMASRGLTR